MFDGRETISPLKNLQTFQANLNADLAHQAICAVQTHAQGSVQPTPAQLADIVNFELGLTTAQIRANRLGHLYVDGATGGPIALSTQPYYPGLMTLWDMIPLASLSTLLPSPCTRLGQTPRTKRRETSPRAKLSSIPRSRPLRM